MCIFNLLFSYEEMFDPLITTKTYPLLCVLCCSPASGGPVQSEWERAGRRVPEASPPEWRGGGPAGRRGPLHYSQPAQTVPPGSP